MEKEKKELLELKLKEAVSVGMAYEDLSQDQLARKMGTSSSTLHGIFYRQSASINKVIEIFENVGAELIVRYDNGEEVKLLKKQD